MHGCMDAGGASRVTSVQDNRQTPGSIQYSVHRSHRSVLMRSTGSYCIKPGVRRAARAGRTITVHKQLALYHALLHFLVVNYWDLKVKRQTSNMTRNGSQAPSTKAFRVSFSLVGQRWVRLDQCSTETCLTLGQPRSASIEGLKPWCLAAIYCHEADLFGKAQMLSVSLCLRVVMR